ncbi:MAG: small basic protein [Victivallales bacterium]|jgi:small basic protein (TIGR04137 family)|nr:small basic protein [Victivallales bacterium]MBT7298505.1 small basic protein [Victivallales bacterium]
MSVHPSLKTKGAVAEKRNVMKRFERIDALKADGRYKEGEKVWGLPKTKIVN